MYFGEIYAALVNMCSLGISKNLTDLKLLNSCAYLKIHKNKQIIFK